MEFLTLSDRIDLGVMGGFGELNEALNCAGFCRSSIRHKEAPTCKKRHTVEWERTRPQKDQPAVRILPKGSFN